MTTAFVLGGGGVLGAVEVGMLRALLERGIVPDLVLGTSVGALNGAMVARQPELAVVERLTELWAATARSRDVYGDRPLRTVRRAVTSGTHIYSSGPLRQRLQDELGDATFEDLPVRLGVCAASIERAAEHWFTTGPLVPAILASAAVPGLLPPAEVDGEHFLDGGLVNSVPVGKAVELGATRVFVLQVGRIDRPLTVPTRPWEVARVSFEVARRHRFMRDMATIPEGVEAHVLPAGGTSAQGRLAARAPGLLRRPGPHRCDVRRLPPLPRRDPRHRVSRGVSPGVSPGVWILRRLVVAPAVIGLTIADLGDPAAVAARRGCALAAAARPVAGAAALLGRGGLPDLRDPAAHGDARPVAGERLRVADPVALLRRHPLRPRAGHADRLLPRGPTRAGAADPHRRAAPAAHAGRAGAGDVPPRGTRRLVHPDVRPAALVRPRAARGPQEHPRVGPGHRRGAATDPGALHLARTPRRARTSSRRSRPSRAAWTATTPS